LDAAIEAEIDRIGSVPGVTSPSTPFTSWRNHDLRRTVATGMAKLGVDLPVIEKVLNHSSGSFAGVVGIYQRHTFAQEKRQALDIWGSFVTSLTSRNDQVAQALSVRGN
jgi:integrase